MSRSIKKGPFVAPELYKRVEELNKTGEKKVLKTWSMISVNTKTDGQKFFSRLYVDITGISLICRFDQRIDQADCRSAFHFFCCLSCFSCFFLLFCYSFHPRQHLLDLVCRCQHRPDLHTGDRRRFL